jgi:hypothetical protein
MAMHLISTSSDDTRKAQQWAYVIVNAQARSARTYLAYEE